MSAHKNQVGQAGAGVNGGEFARKTQTDDDLTLPAELSSVAERYAAPEWSKDDLSRIFAEDAVEAVVENPDDNDPVFVRRYRTVTEANRAEKEMTVERPYDALPGVQKQTVDTVLDAAEQLWGRVIPSKYRPHTSARELPNGNASVRAVRHFGNAQLLEMHHRIEITPAGDVAAHHVTFFPCSKWAEVKGAEDLQRVYGNRMALL